MTRDQRILQFYQGLDLNDNDLPRDVRVMNPYKNPSPEVEAVIRTFYHKYYGDLKPRGLILGINPGRFGAGVTGIPFTDSYRLEEHCNIPFPGDTRETSSQFVYDVISAYGGSAQFYTDWFIGAVSPLGFIHKNDKGNWVNWNYYDQAELESAIRPYIIDTLKAQHALCGSPGVVVVLGTGKNYNYLQKLNKSIGLFDEVLALEHPRYIMQYKLKHKEQYVDKFLTTLDQAFRKSF